MMAMSNNSQTPVPKPSSSKSFPKPSASASKPFPKSNTTKQRKLAILDKNKTASFNLKPNPEAISDEPWYSVESYSEVDNNNKIIEKEAKKAGLDSDMVKGIIYLETTQGYYDRWIPKGTNKSIRPMNLYYEYWKELGYSREDLENPEKNIQAGVELLKRIKENMPEASVAEIATMYNNLGAKEISDYGTRVEKLTKEKPWEK